MARSLSRSFQVEPRGPQYGFEFLTPSSTGQGGYVVSRDARTCDCPDYTRRETACKHIFSVRLAN